jgi:hypothetical protein
MKRPALILLLSGLLFTALSAAIVVDAKVPVGTLAGTVLDVQGKPVARASVTIQTSDGLHPNAMLTDSAGHFAFARYKTGQYDLRASSSGATSDWMKRIMIRSSKTTEVTLRLGPPKPSHTN